jgi:hypothetical protein
MMRMAMGARNLAKPTGPKTILMTAVMLKGNVLELMPIQFRSSHAPVKAAGNWTKSATCIASGPSLEKCT